MALLSTGILSQVKCIAFLFLRPIETGHLFLPGT